MSFNLNSIMILLIPSGTKKQVVLPTLFKFHYDSINSQIIAPFDAFLFVFKFHYDSINSYIKMSQRPTFKQI